MCENAGTLASLTVGGRSYRYAPVSAVEGWDRLPYTLKVLLENVVRRHGAAGDARAVVEAGLAAQTGPEVEFMPARVLFQDFTGVPVMADFAAMREAVAALGGDARRVNPLIHCDLVIDHSVIGDVAGCPGAAAANERIEFERNEERYRFLTWAQSSLDNVTVLPPAAGICHQLDIELLAPGVMVDAAAADGAAPLAYFDTVVGTDSHTTTVDGIGVLGWGVGGIEAEAVALGQPISILVPKTLGIHMTGRLSEGVSAMDLALTVAELLRAKGVVGCFVEAFGPGVSTLTATQRTCVSNMSPEYGCTCLYFPFDEQTLAYYAMTGRDPEQVALVEAYAKAQGLWHDPAARAVYAEVIELDLSSVERVVAGPARPHQRIPLAGAQAAQHAVTRDHGREPGQGAVEVRIGENAYELGHGTLAIAAITSCTTTADPAMMVAAGLLAKKAADKGIYAKPWVKRLLSPGSHASELLLERCGLLGSLELQGFYTAGFGCMSCIGNSGPVNPALHEVAGELDLAAVVSGNRNFEGRISPDVSQNYLAAPATVVAYALAGTVDVDFAAEPLGVDEAGAPVYLADIWPTDAEVAALVDAQVCAELYRTATEGITEGGPAWRSLAAEPSVLFPWDEASTYIRRPPYFDGMGAELPAAAPICGARALARFGDFITTDHISPAGSIAADAPAARYLRERGVADADFNTYGSRRGNHEVMERGTFANVKLKNALAAGKVGCWTLDQLDGGVKSVWDAAVDYAEHGVPLVVVAGQMYGSGSSRDWAAKGPMLQGVRAVLAASFERIHRSNLVGMGILPLQFANGQGADSLGLDGTEVYDIPAVDFEGAELPLTVEVRATDAAGNVKAFPMTVRVDTPTEAAYMANGGILQYMVRSMAGRA
jgi:aconitate hydratase